jgi:hypothetical protein
MPMKRKIANRRIVDNSFKALLSVKPPARRDANKKIIEQSPSR